MENSLVWCADHLVKLVTLDINIGKKYFFSTSGKNSELERGMKMLEIILKVIGDKTFRFLISHSIKHNGVPTQLRPGITNWGTAKEIAKYSSQFGFYSSNSISWGVHAPSISQYVVHASKTSLFFGMASIFFPMKVNGEETRSHTNEFSLEHPPLSFLNVNERFTSSLISTELEKLLNSEYNEYISRVNDYQMDIYTARSKVVFDSTSVYFEQLRTIIEKIPDKHWETLLGGPVETLDTRRIRATRHAELYIRSNMESIRFTIEDAIRNGRTTTEISIPDLGKFIYPIYKTNAEVYGLMSRINSYESRVTISERAINERVEILKAALRRRNDWGRFYIAADTKDYGLQYLSITKSGDFLQNLFPDAIVGAGNGIYVDVHVGYKQTLRSLAILSMSYINNGGEQAIVSLIMKEMDSGIQDQALMILAGDRFITEVDSEWFKGASQYSHGYTRLKHDVLSNFVESPGLVRILGREVSRKYAIFNVGQDYTQMDTIYA